jgi:OOP family OmpA-OmpF porin
MYAKYFYFVINGVFLTKAKQKAIKMKLTKFILVGALATGVAACAAPQPTKLNLEEMVGYHVNHPAGEVEGSKFALNLHKEYYELGKYEALLGDNEDATFFWQRANMVGDGNVPAPSMVSERNIKNDTNLIAGRNRLVGLLDDGVQNRYPETMAYAQAMFDCWVEQHEESYQTYDIENCRSRFWTAIKSLNTKKPEPREPDVVISAFDVFFGLDKHALTSDARSVLNSVPEQLKKFKASRIVITGYTDTSGSKDHNMTLSLKRAESVAKYLRSIGVNGDVLEIRPMGEDNPPVPTEDGVVNASNRTAQVRFVE